MFYLRQATNTQTRSIGPFVDDTDFKTAETSLTINASDVKITKNGTATTKNSGGGTHTNNGMYSFTFDSTDTDTVGELKISILVSGAAIVIATFFVLEETIYDALFGSSAPGYLQPQVAGRTIDITASGTVGINWQNIENPSSYAPLSATDIRIVNTSINNTDMRGTDNALLASSAPTNFSNLFISDGQGYVRISGTLNTLDELSITDPWDTSLPGAYSSGKAGHIVGTFLNAKVSEVPSGVWSQPMAIHSGNAGTMGPYLYNSALEHEDVWLTNLPGSYSPGQAGYVLGTTLIHEAQRIPSGVWHFRMEEFVDLHWMTFGSGVYRTWYTVNEVNTPALIADAVWEEQISDHSGTSGSTAEALNAAGAAGDPWSTSLPGAYSAGQAGNIVGNLFNTIPSGVWSILLNNYTKYGTIGSGLNDILTDTTILNANQNNWLTATGFSTHSADDVWNVSTRRLTDAANITSNSGVINVTSGSVNNVILVNTTTTNTDMRGTDNAFLASSVPVNFGLLAIDSNGYVKISGTISSLDDLNTSIVTLIGTLPTASGISDYVWEEQISDHSGTSGSVAEALNAAGSAGDPWTTALPGSYTSGQAGYIVGTYLDAAVSSAGGDGLTNSSIASGVWSTLMSSFTQYGTMGSGLNDTLSDTTNLRDNQGNWLTATGFSTHSADDVWNVTTRRLTDAANITSDSGVINTNSGTINRVTLVDTVTTNTDLGTNGDGLTNIPWNSSWESHIRNQSASGVLSANYSQYTVTGTIGKLLSDILGDTNELQSNQGNWLTATGFSTHSAADVWAVSTRRVSDAANITSDSGVIYTNNGVINRVSLVDVTTTNTDMRGTDNALLASNVPTNFNYLSIDSNGYIKVSGTISTLDDLNTSITSLVGTLPTASGIADTVWREQIEDHANAGTMASGIKDIVTPIYYADIKYLRDIRNSRDEFSVTWFKNSNIVNSFSNPFISVYNTSDGSSIFENTAMTNIGHGSARYNTSGIVLASGEPYIVRVSGVIDNNNYKWSRIIGINLAS